MNKNLQHIYLVANGDIEDPIIEITVDEHSRIVKGRDARTFAIGFLAGVKAQKDGFTANNQTVSIEG